MKTIHNILLSGCVAVAMFAAATAQNTSNKAVPLSIYVPEQAESMPDIAEATMVNKMNQMVNLNGMSATNDFSQFFITFNVAVSDKNIIAGAPVKISQKMDITFYIGDAIDKKMYGTTTISVRGVGDNENKAYIAL